jgi:hypothetical protein
VSDEKEASMKASRPHRVPLARRRQRLIVKLLPEETLVYDVDCSRAHCLGPVAAAVWRRCDGRSSAAQVARAVARETGTEVDEAAVWVAVGRLGEAKLLEEKPEALGGRSRRDWLKEAAFLAGVSVVSITAPLALEAATCVSNCSSRPDGPGNCGAIPCCPPATGSCCRQGNGGNCQCKNGACSP